MLFYRRVWVEPAGDASAILLTSILVVAGVTPILKKCIILSDLATKVTTRMIRPNCVVTSKAKLCSNFHCQILEVKPTRWRRFRDPSHLHPYRRWGNHYYGKMYFSFRSGNKSYSSNNLILLVNPNFEVIFTAESEANPPATLLRSFSPPSSSSQG